MGFGDGMYSRSMCDSYFDRADTFPQSLTDHIEERGSSLRDFFLRSRIKHNRRAGYDYYENVI